MVARSACGSKARLLLAGNLGFATLRPAWNAGSIAVGRGAVFLRGAPSGWRSGGIGPSSPILLFYRLGLPFGFTDGREFPGVALGPLIMKDHIEERFVYKDATVVVNKAQLPKAVHEEADF